MFSVLVKIDEGYRLMLRRTPMYGGAGVKLRIKIVLFFWKTT